MTMHNFVVVNSGIDFSELKLALDADELELFETTQNRSYATDALDRVGCIWISAPCKKDLAMPETYLNNTNNVWHTGYYHLPLVRHLVHSLAYEWGAHEIGRVIISRMDPGVVFPRHYDDGAGNEGYVRFHFAINNAPGSKFYCGDDEQDEECFEASTGDVFFFRNDKYHWVSNESQEVRYTMVCDLKITGMEWKTNHNSKRDKAARLLAKENRDDNVPA